MDNIKLRESFQQIIISEMWFIQDIHKIHEFCINSGNPDLKYLNHLPIYEHLSSHLISFSQSLRKKHREVVSSILSDIELNLAEEGTGHTDGGFEHYFEEQGHNQCVIDNLRINVNKLIGESKKKYRDLLMLCPRTDPESEGLLVESAVEFFRGVFTSGKGVIAKFIGDPQVQGRDSRPENKDGDFKGFEVKEQEIELIPPPEGEEKIKGGTEAKQDLKTPARIKDSSNSLKKSILVKDLHQVWDKSIQTLPKSVIQKSIKKYGLDCDLSTLLHQKLSIKIKKFDIGNTKWKTLSCIEDRSIVICSEGEGIEKLNIYSGLIDHIGTCKYSRVVHFKHNNTFYGHFNRKMHVHTQGADIDLKAKIWFPGGLRTIEKALNDEDLMITTDKNQITIYFGAGLESANITDLSQLASHRIQLDQGEQIRQFRPLKDDKILIMTLKGRLYLYSYSKSNQRRLSSVGALLDRDEHTTSLVVSKNEDYIVFSTRLKNWKFGRLLYTKINSSTSQIGEIHDFDGSSFLMEDMFFTDLNLDLELAGVPILTAFPSRNMPDIYFFAIEEEGIRVLGKVHSGCVGRITRCNFALGKVMTVDSEGILLTIDLGGGGLGKTKGFQKRFSGIQQLGGVEGIRDGSAQRVSNRRLVQSSFLTRSPFKSPESDDNNHRLRLQTRRSYASDNRGYPTGGFGSNRQDALRRFQTGFGEDHSGSLFMKRNSNTNESFNLNGAGVAKKHEF